MAFLKPKYSKFWTILNTMGGTYKFLIKPGNSCLAMNEKPKLPLMYRPEASNGVLNFIGALWVYLHLKKEILLHQQKTPQLIQALRNQQPVLSKPVIFSCYRKLPNIAKNHLCHFTVGCAELSEKRRASKSFRAIIKLFH